MPTGMYFRRKTTAKDKHNKVKSLMRKGYTFQEARRKVY